MPGTAVDVDKNMKKQPFQLREEAIKELFYLAYTWGGMGIEADHTSPAFRKQLIKVIDLFENETITHR